jgi:CRP-like cAMP-binding protein
METERIAAIPLFADLPDDELEAVASSAREHEVASGHAVATEGDFGHALFAIESGTAEIVSDGAPVGAVGPGDVVGEVAVLTSGRRTASIVATSPLRMIVWFKPDVWRLERSAPEAARRLRALVADHLGPA